MEKRNNLCNAIKWPITPSGFENFTDKLKQMYEIWRANKIINQMPLVLKESLKEKLAAFHALENKRREWGYLRSWKGDYLNLDDEIKSPSQRYDYLLELDNIRRNSNFTKVLFSSYIQVLIYLLIFFLNLILGLIIYFSIYLNINLISSLTVLKV
ncbi:unnamed protein product [Brugia pahangi]|uniref:Uncharacterized protein n=1 Tax=Brugia pahangi TaxID=6280 RepID=A0A0N4TG47_BRUPA|nr:unnamed protein product [Brugia pahangi]